MTARLCPTNGWIARTLGPRGICAGLLTGVLCLLAASGCARQWCVDRAAGPLPHGAEFCSACEGDGCGACLGNPISFIQHRLTCASGCGEFYWDEWFCDPPDCCDPCDENAVWIGPRSCPPKPLTYHNLWGIQGNCQQCVDCLQPVQVFEEDGVLIEEPAGIGGPHPARREAAGGGRSPGDSSVKQLPQGRSPQPRQDSGNAEGAPPKAETSPPKKPAGDPTARHRRQLRYYSR